MRSTLTRALAAVLLAAGFAATAAMPAAAQDTASQDTASQDTVPWAVSTAANEFGADRVNYSYTAGAGEQVHDGLKVVNNGTAPLELAVYTADAFTRPDGQVDLLARDKKSVGVGAWARAAADHVKLGPGESADVPFTITVPSGTKAGDFLGGIVTSVQQGTVERRLGIRIRLRVGGDLAPALSVEDAHVDYSGTANPFGSGDATLSYTLHNTGNAITAARQSASVSSLFGAWTAPAATIPDSPQLLPGETWHVSVPVHGVVPGVRLSADVSLTPLLTDASGSVAPLAVVTGSAGGWAIPWTLLVVLVLLVLVVVFVIRRLRKRRAGSAEGSPVELPSETPETAAEPETAESETAVS
ncbi:WxL protein peptidoglycan domain-containing protein [Amycolatopsis sp. NPDC001319]|uniref:WxL protein peptidoglycan domain-containing protein n=1 Tax=unclassified Amycolatopsis TaxID=2618356 RepID=UPI0036A05E14